MCNTCWSEELTGITDLTEGLWGITGWSEKLKVLPRVCDPGKCHFGLSYKSEIPLCHLRPTGNAPWLLRPSGNTSLASPDLQSIQYKQMVLAEKKSIIYNNHMKYLTTCQKRGV